MIRTARVALACLGLVAVLPLHAQLRVPSQGAGPRLSLPAPTGQAAQAARPAVQRQADYIVAVVNSEPVTNNEVRARALRLQQQLAQQGGEMPPASQLLAVTLERLISERAQQQHARDIGIKVEDTAVDQAEASVAAQNQISVTELRRRVESEGLASTQFRDDLRNQILLQRLRERDFESRVRVSDIEVDQYLRDQRQSSDPARTELNIGQILVAVPENATPAQVAELQAKAQRGYERARGGEDFTALVRELSTDPEAQAGGQFGLRPASRYPELFIETVRPLAVGAVAPPVRSGAGFHVLKLVEKRKSSGVESSTAQSRARHILLRPGPQLTQEQAIQRLASYKQRVQSGGADFAQLARENSQDGSASDGGDLGWTRPGQFVPEFEEAMNRLAPNEISEPLVSRFGVHLIQLQERRNVALNEREVREAARAKLRETKLESTFDNWARDIRARAYVEMREPPQ